ncbi:hypothetical protein GYO_2122 [Bacillus spizizenii TU-B-10]|uniref:Uncharacterized protein n=1 Tax=Bacillus spizizenii (strain DSM 15029 / JCM 12233 / NBRC 101239 / NRRL B-23049 / TU-B-10) TaxID=1052585 RepID=G4NVS4_BACS4|nr:hypothetical protein GYO_2122 [Bacillus spizizenii TU-B-10]SCV41351.1 hypothetical protein BQ1740_2438 [Bacillus subtilis]
MGRLRKCVKEGGYQTALDSCSTNLTSEYIIKFMFRKSFK